MVLVALVALAACARPGSGGAYARAALARAVPVQSAESRPCANGGRAPPDPDAPTPANEPLQPGAGPTLMLSQAWFYKHDGKPAPGPARLIIYRQTPSGWVSSKLEDADSNVFHQSFSYGSGVVTLGAERALLRLWTPGPQGWSASTLFEGDWCGKFDRLRELERGDVDGDGDEEWVIATHDQGVVVVLDGAPGRQHALELDADPDTFVHEIELGDLTGDGIDEIVATRTHRLFPNGSSEVAMYHWTPAGYLRETLLEVDDVAIREALLADLDGDGRDEVYLSAEYPSRNSEGPQGVDVWRLRLRAGRWTHETVAHIDDRSVRFLLAADTDGDHHPELVATGMRGGVYQMIPQGTGPWPVTRISDQSSGFEHAAIALDLDQDGRDELYIADDDHHELERLTLDPGSGAWCDDVIGTFEERSFTWTIARGP